MPYGFSPEDLYANRFASMFNPVADVRDPSSLSSLKYYFPVSSPGSENSIADQYDIPDTPILRKYQEHLARFPTREPTSKVSRLLAALAGTAAGMQGRDPLSTAVSYMEIPRQQREGDWQKQAVALGNQAAIESDNLARANQAMNYRRQMMRDRETTDIARQNAESNRIRAEKTGQNRIPSPFINSSGGMFDVRDPNNPKIVPGSQPRPVQAPRERHTTITDETGMQYDYNYDTGEKRPIGLGKTNKTEPVGVADKTKAEDAATQQILVKYPQFAKFITVDKKLGAVSIRDWGKDKDLYNAPFPERTQLANEYKAFIKLRDQLVQEYLGQSVGVGTSKYNIQRVK